MGNILTTNRTEKITHQGKTIEVVQKQMGPNSKTWTLEFARRSPGTRLIIEKEDKIILSREFRHELESCDYRLPGGKVFDSLEEYNKALETKVDISEAAKKCAIEEARQEVGVKVKNISFLHKSICGVTIVWDLYYFVVKDFDEVPQDLGEGEEIQVEIVDREKAKAMCLNGQISEERSALILFRYLNSGF